MENSKFKIQNSEVKEKESKNLIKYNFNFLFGGV